MVRRWEQQNPHTEKGARDQKSAANLRKAAKPLSERYDYKYLNDSAQHDEELELE